MECTDPLRRTMYPFEFKVLLEKYRRTGGADRQRACMLSGHQMRLAN